MELSPEPFMLSYIWQQHCWIVAFSRCLIVKCGMTPLKVVSMNILSDGSSGFLDIIILCQIGFLILEASKPAFNHDIVRPAAFSIRGSCIGKKNWEVIDTINGAKTSAVIYSIAETAKANNLKPYEYFEHLLTVIPEHMEDTDRSFLEELLPWSPALPENIRK